jgi:cell wall-associated NlpC family hydrolase
MTVNKSKFSPNASGASLIYPKESFPRTQSDHARPKRFLIQGCDCTGFVNWIIEKFKVNRKDDSQVLTLEKAAAVDKFLHRHPFDMAFTSR